MVAGMLPQTRYRAHGRFLMAKRHQRARGPSCSSSRPGEASHVFCMANHPSKDALAESQAWHILVSRRAFPAAESPSCRLGGRGGTPSDVVRWTARMPPFGTGPLSNAHAWPTPRMGVCVWRSLRQAPFRARCQLLHGSLRMGGRAARPTNALAALGNYVDGR